MSVRRILVPIDYSPGSRVALERALDLAIALKAAVDVLHVLDVPGGHPEKELRHFCEGIAKLPGHRIGTRIGSGDAATSITHTAEEGGYDLVVMGTHGRRGVSRALIGSVAEEVVRTSLVPVVTVRLGAPTPSRQPARKRAGARAARDR